MLTKRQLIDELQKPRSPADEDRAQQKQEHFHKTCALIREASQNARKAEEDARKWRQTIIHLERELKQLTSQKG